MLYWKPLMEFIENETSWNAFNKTKNYYISLGLFAYVEVVLMYLIYENKTIRRLTYSYCLWGRLHMEDSKPY